MRRLLIVTAIGVIALWAIAGCMKTENPAAPADIMIPVLPAYDWGGDGVPCGDSTGYTLYAGQYIDVGTVTVTLDNGELCIDIQTTGGWVMTETHVAVAPYLDSIPQTGSGNPQVGKFLWETQHDPAVTQMVYCCDPLEYIWTPGDIVIAVHASVVLLDDAGNPVQEETAWGDGPEFPGHSWATYMNYAVGDCPETPPEIAVSPTGPTACAGGNLNIYWTFDGALHDVVLIEAFVDGEFYSANYEIYAGPITPYLDEGNGVYYYNYDAPIDSTVGTGPGYQIRVTDITTGISAESAVPFEVQDCNGGGGGGGEKR